MTTTTTPAVDVDEWGHTAALREAEAAVDAATTSGDVDQIAAAAHALIVAAAAHGWHTATALVFTYETTGPVAHLWGLWRVVDVDGRVLREWEDEPGDMTDESEEEASCARPHHQPRRDAARHGLRHPDGHRGDGAAHAHALSMAAGRPCSGRLPHEGETPSTPLQRRSRVPRSSALSCAAAACTSYPPGC